MRVSLSLLRLGCHQWRNSKELLRIFQSKAERLSSNRNSSISSGRICKMSHLLKSPYDKKNYREITLNNGLTALLISDMDQLTLRPLPVHKHKKGNRTSSSESDTEEMDCTSEETEETDGGMLGIRTTSESSPTTSTVDLSQVSGLLMATAKESFASVEHRKAAAALCVGVGSFCDPEDIPGFAHFLEHMVFMGSKKYKKENAFDDYISKHGGESNAWTDSERTVFFFDIHKNNFHKALDMFAQFFISPLFIKSSVEREIMAVDNEFQMIQQNDNDRYHQLLGSLSFPGNPMGRFLCGNVKTLKHIPQEKGIEVHGRLHDLSRRIYSAHYMTLVIQAPESLDSLQDLVHDLFENIPNNGLLPPSVVEYRDPFVPRNFHKLLKVVPVEDCQRLDICWPFPPLYKRFKVKPLEYLGTLITHEGLGSVMACLRRRGLALTLSGGNNATGFDQNKLWSGFNITILLTNTGMESVCEVMSILFEYIAMLQKCGPQAWFYKEMRDIENIKFRFRDECDPIENVEQIAENMQMYPLEHYLTGRSLILSYDAQLLRECLSYLTPMQACVTLWSKAYEGHGVCDQVEPWFGTHYSITDIPEEWESQWANLKPRAELYLPEKNPFIPAHFDLLEMKGTSEYPVQVLDNEFGRMWYKKDKKFKMPKGFILLHLMTPFVSNSVNGAVLCDLYINLLEQQLLETLYAASLTGYEFSLEGMTTGMVVHLEGFSHKLPRVLELFITHLSEFSATQELFDAVKSQLKKTYYNEMLKTYEFAKMVRFAVTEPMNQPVPDRYLATDSMTLPMLQEFHRHLTDFIYVEGLMTGNFSPRHAVDVAEYVQKKLCRVPLPTDKLPVKRILKLPQGDLQCRVKGVNHRDTNSCVTSYFQHGPGSIRDACLNELLSTRMKEPVFNRLRTELQLGYSVFCQHHMNSSVMGFSVTVETHANKFSVSDVEQHIVDFMEAFKKTMYTMTRPQFVDLVNSVITSKQVEDTQLGDETSRFWQEVLDRSYIYDRQEKEIETLGTIQQAELKAWYQKYMDPSHLHVSFQVEGCKHQEMEVEEGVIPSDPTSSADTENFLHPISQGKGFINNVVKFRKSLELYPAPKMAS